jgi:RNA polymerase sigma factor (sigma-70 family)
MMKVVRDTVRDYWRRRRHPDELTSLDEVRLAERPLFEDELDRRKQTDLLRQALLQIDPEKRTTLELFYVHNRSIAEIARIQNRSASAVKMQLVRSRKLLAAIISSLFDKKSP